MATDTTKYAAQSEPEARHSALEELYRDERRPALLLLGGLVIAVTFFALGIMVGRWVGSDAPHKTAASPAPVPAIANSTQPTQTAPANSAGTSNTSRDPQRRYTLLVATYNTPEEAQPLIKRLERAGYKDVRTSTPRMSDRQPKFSVLMGHYKRDEAEQMASRMRASGDSSLRYVRVIEDTSN